LVNIVGDAEIRGLLMRPQECGEPSVRIASTAAHLSFSDPAGGQTRRDRRLTVIVNADAVSAPPVAQP
jgi:hypothetical protein